MTAESGRAAVRTRERILQAAVEEFGAKGYAGARTAGIAARAGVNPQLISYYFGGKRGLLAELRRQWAKTEATLVPPDASFAESVSAYFDATLDQPAWARLVIWQALGDDPGGGDDPSRGDPSGGDPSGGAAGGGDDPSGGSGGGHSGGPRVGDEPGDGVGDDPSGGSGGDPGSRTAAQAAKLAGAVERIRQRQRDGEITDRVEAGLILLLAHAFAFAPIAMPQIVAAIFQVDPLSPELRHRLLRGLLTLTDPERSTR